MRGNDGDEKGYEEEGEKGLGCEWEGCEDWLSKRDGEGFIRY